MAASFFSFLKLDSCCINPQLPFEDKVTQIRRTRTNTPSSSRDTEQSFGRSPGNLVLRPVNFCKKQGGRGIMRMKIHYELQLHLFGG